MKEYEIAHELWNTASEGVQVEEITEEDFCLPKEMQPIFERFIKESKDILDFGCGCGEMLFAAAKEYQLTSGLGMDYGEKTMAFTTKLAKYLQCDDKLEFRAGGVEELKKLPSKSMGGIIVSNVFDIVPAEVAEEMMMELVRILKEGGYFLLKLNGSMEDCESEKYRLTKIKDNLYERDGFLRLRNCSTSEWRRWFSSWFEELDYTDVPYQTPKDYDRLFLLKKKANIER
ncbi:hypothetical protein lbkm_1483 [Lachnospiraceae bacterium KM106-2]|nr:hypothetical protein lbkm_1483 [Lachnospiraceae bacterium KM106-2]